MLLHLNLPAPEIFQYQQENLRLVRVPIDRKLKHQLEYFPSQGLCCAARFLPVYIVLIRFIQPAQSGAHGQQKKARPKADSAATSSRSARTSRLQPL